MKTNSKQSDKTDIIQWKIKGFNIINFMFKEPIGKSIEDKLKIGIKHRFNIKPNDNLFQIFIVVDYFYEIETDKVDSILSIEIVTDFEIKNMSEVFKIDNKSFKMNNDLLITFISLAYSSIRGIIFAKTQGSFINQFILPTIPLDNVIKMVNEISNSNIEKE